jgi:hypothetical protein
MELEPYEFIKPDEIRIIAKKYNKQVEGLEGNIQKFNAILDSIYCISNCGNTGIKNEDTIIRILGDAVHDIGPHAYNTNIAGYLGNQIGANINIDNFFTKPGMNPMETNIKKFLNEYLIKYDNANTTSNYIDTFEYNGTTLEFKNIVQNAGCDYIILDAQFGNPIMKYFSKLSATDNPFTYIDSTVGFADGASKLSYDTIVENNGMNYMPDYNPFIVHNFFKNRNHSFNTSTEEKGKKTIVKSDITVYDINTKLFNLSVNGGFSVNSICKLTDNVICRGDSDAKNIITPTPKTFDRAMKNETLLIKTITDYSQVYYAAFLWHILGIKSLFVTNDSYCLPLTRLFKLPFVLFTKKHDQVGYIFDEDAVTLSDVDKSVIIQKAESFTDVIKEDIYKKFNTLVDIIKRYTLDASKVSKFLSSLMTLTKLKSIKSTIDERINDILKIKSGSYDENDIKRIITLKNSSSINEYIFDFTLQNTYITGFLELTTKSIEHKYAINSTTFNSTEFYNNIYKIFIDGSIDISYVSQEIGIPINPVVLTEIIISKIFSIQYNTYYLLDTFISIEGDNPFTINYPTTEDKMRFSNNIAKYSSVLFMLNGIISRLIRGFITDKKPQLNTVLTLVTNCIPILSILNNTYTFKYDIKNILNNSLHEYYNESMESFVNMRGQSKDSVDKVAQIFQEYFVHHTDENDIFHNSIYLDLIKIAHISSYNISSLDPEQIQQINKVLSHIYEIFIRNYTVTPVAPLAGKKRGRNNNIETPNSLPPKKKIAVARKKGGDYDMSDYVPFIANYYMKPFNINQYGDYKVNIMRNKYTKDTILYKSSISSDAIDELINDIIINKTRNISQDYIYNMCKKYIEILDILHDDAAETGEGDEYINTLQILKEMFYLYNEEEGLPLYIIINQIFAYLFDKDGIINKYFFNLIHPSDIIDILNTLHVLKITSINIEQAKQRSIGIKAVPKMRTGLDTPTMITSVPSNTRTSIFTGGTRKNKRWAKTRKAKDSPTKISRKKKVHSNKKKTLKH